MTGGAYYMSRFTFNCKRFTGSYVPLIYLQVSVVFRCSNCLWTWLDFPTIMQLDTKISWMMSMQIYLSYSSPVAMFVELFTALSVLVVMNCLLIYQKMASLLLVIYWNFIFPVFFLVIDWSKYVSCFWWFFEAYHAGLNNKLRSSVLDDWISSKIQVVVATVAFG